MAENASITEIAGRLYGLPVTEFTAARDAESRSLKDAGNSALAGEVKRLKKPAAGAHLVNLLVRADSALLDDIGDLGSRLRAEQGDPEPGRLRALDQERRSLVARSVKAAAAEAERGGARATAASLRDVEQTVWAAVVDPGGFATVRAGLLIRPLSPSGFGSVDLADASALPVEIDDVAPLPRRAATKKRPGGASAPPAPEAAPQPAPPDRAAERARLKAVKDARAGVETAEAELHRAEATLEESSQRAHASGRRLSELQDELTGLRDRIAAIEESVHQSRLEQSDAKTAVRAAEKERRAAAAAAGRARSRLDDLTETS